MQTLSKSNSFNLPPSARLNRLSPAEQSVVTLLLEGLSNRAIAQKLVLSPRDDQTSFIARGLRFSSC